MDILRTQFQIFLRIKLKNDITENTPVIWYQLNNDIAEKYNNCRLNNDLQLYDII